MKILKNKGARMEEWGLNTHLLRSFVIRQTYLQARRNSGGGGRWVEGGGVQHPQISAKVDISLIDNDRGNKNIATKNTK